MSHFPSLRTTAVCHPRNSERESAHKPRNAPPWLLRVCYCSSTGCGIYPHCLGCCLRRMIYEVHDIIICDVYLASGSMIRTSVFLSLSVQGALNQYSLPLGLKSLQSAVSTYYNKCYGLREGAANRAIVPENVLVS